MFTRSSQIRQTPMENFANNFDFCVQIHYLGTYFSMSRAIILDEILFGRILSFIWTSSLIVYTSIHWIHDNT